MTKRMQRAVQVFLTSTTDMELLSMVAEKRYQEQSEDTYFLASADVEAELTRRFDTHLGAFFGI